MIRADDASSLGVLEAFENYHNFIEDLKNASSDFRSHGIGQLLRSAPDLTPLTEAVRSMFHVAESEIKQLASLCYHMLIDIPL